MTTDSRNPTEGFQALGIWLLVYVAASFASVVVLVATGQSSGDSPPMWVLALNVGAMWTVYLTMLPRLLPFTAGALRVEFWLWFRPADLWRGVVLGVGSQLILMNLVNWPLAQLFPDQFSPENISERADEIASTAPGWWGILLVLVVVIGAPIVEEIVYRGCLQSRLEQGFGPLIGIGATAAVFALIHLTPVEIPGLFVFALVLGLLRHTTGRLGTPIVTHMAFNATGLMLVMVF